MTPFDSAFVATFVALFVLFWTLWFMIEKKEKLVLPTLTMVFVLIMLIIIGRLMGYESSLLDFLFKNPEKKPAESEYESDIVNYSGKAYALFSASDNKIRDKEEMRKFCKERGGKLAVGETKDQCVFLARLILNSGLDQAAIETQKYDLDIGYIPFEDTADYFICQWESEYPGAEEDKMYPPDGALIYGDHSYLIITYKESGVRDWEELVAYCNLRGGYPAVINDREENEALYRYTLDNGKKNVIFGYTDKGHEGKWQWVRGANSNTFNNYWVPDQPDNDGEVEHYACFNDTSADGRWNDVPFNLYTDSFLCEWNGVSTD